MMHLVLDLECAKLMTLFKASDIPSVYHLLYFPCVQVSGLSVEHLWQSGHMSKPFVLLSVGEDNHCFRPICV